MPATGPNTINPETMDLLIRFLSVGSTIYWSFSVNEFSSTVAIITPPGKKQLYHNNDRRF